MITQPSKSKFAIKQKNARKLEHYLNSKNWVVFSTEKVLVVNSRAYSLFHYITKTNYLQIFKKAELNSKILLVGDYKDVIVPYRILQSWNKKVYLITI